MYSYTHDPRTGGLLLNSTPTLFSKEPRPVYAPELDILGFDEYWNYDIQQDLPYMWAEANKYYYRGTLVAELRGGDVFTRPEIIIPQREDGRSIAPEPDGVALRPIDIDGMVAANRDMLMIIERSTVKKILAVYTKHKKKLDCFHVAFSGGKDSCVLLDLVKKALPKGSFIVVFADTGMEFPDTYDLINKVQAQCLEDEIPFYIAKSHLSPQESWKLFGPPSRALRWCCSVHKSAPQALKLREITGKSDYKGLAFVGVRKWESATRAEYEDFNDGKKTRGQYSHNSILEWTSAEIWLYIYENNTISNKAYSKGSARVGCLCCPLGGGKASYIENRNYAEKVNGYLELIKQSNGRQNIDIDEFVKVYGWSARNNGRDLVNNPNRYIERVENKNLIINIENPTSDWREWIKTINIPQNAYSVEKTKTGYVATLQEEVVKQNPFIGKLFKQVFHKTTCCKGCGVCETNCQYGAMQFNDSRVHLDGCVHCNQCHSIDSGCLLYHSLRHPQGGGIPMKTLNTMSNHAPKTEWLAAFFEKKNAFFSEHNLGSEQISFFKRLLKDAGLAEKNQATHFAMLVSTIGWSSDTAQALILLNLTYSNSQIEWYVKNLDLGRIYSRKEAVEMLVANEVKSDVAKSICGAFKRLTETPLGTVLHFGHVTDDGCLVRTKCSVTDQRVVLYGLFKFAEKCGDYREFTLSTLLNDDIERDGVSPTRVFGLDREDMMPILEGLSARYSSFINASFTHGLDRITLDAEKTSRDVLDLFKEGR